MISTSQVAFHLTHTASILIQYHYLVTWRSNLIFPFSFTVIAKAHITIRRTCSASQHIFSPSNKQTPRRAHHQIRFQSHLRSSKTLRSSILVRSSIGPFVVVCISQEKPHHTLCVQNINAPTVADSSKAQWPQQA